MKKARNKIIFTIILLMLAATFIAGNYTGRQGVNIGVEIGPKKLINTESGKAADVDFSTFWQAWSKLNGNYVTTLDAQKLVFGAISGLLSSTGDPYTEFFTPSDNQRFKTDISGEFQGIGVEISSINSMPTVVAPLSGSPAELAGLKPKDIILQVDGTKTSDLGFEETINHIRGKAGTTVKLTISRSGVTDPLDISVVRQDIKVPSVTEEDKTAVGKKIAVIKIRQFGNDTITLFDNEINRIKKSGYDGIVLDLRNDPGGYLDAAVSVSSNFIDGGTIVSEVDRSGKKQDIKTSKNVELKNIKLVVLINDGSASASEIVAGALKDRGRAKILGVKSFGKGSVQTMEDLSDGSAVKITIAKWLTPNGTTIDKIGISPDVEVKNDDAIAGDEQMDRAMEEVIK